MATELHQTSRIEILSITPRINFFQFEWEDASYARGPEDDRFLMISVFSVDRGKGEWQCFDMFEQFEHEMLKDFGNLVLERLDESWVGWDCDSFDSGFERLKNRHKELNSTDFPVPRQVIDLLQILRAESGDPFAEEPTLAYATRLFNFNSDGMYFQAGANQHFFEHDQFDWLRKSANNKTTAISKIYFATCTSTPTQVAVTEKMDKPINVELLSIYSNAISDERFSHIDHILRSEGTANEKLHTMDHIMKIPTSASSSQLGKLLCVSGAAIKKTAWWKNNRHGKKAENRKARLVALAEKGKIFDDHIRAKSE